MPDVEPTRQSVGQGSDVCRPAGGFFLAPAAQLFAEGKDVDRGFFLERVVPLFTFLRETGCRREEGLSLKHHQIVLNATPAVVVFQITPKMAGTARCL